MRLGSTNLINSLLRRGSGGVDPLSNVSAGTELQATAESAGASARYHTQDGRHPGCGWGGLRALCHGKDGG